MRDWIVATDKYVAEREALQELVSNRQNRSKDAKYHKQHRNQQATN